MKKLDKANLIENMWSLLEDEVGPTVRNILEIEQYIESIIEQIEEEFEKQFNSDIDKLSEEDLWTT